MPECRFPARAAVLDGNRLDLTAENSARLLNSVDRGIQCRDHGFGVLRKDDQFDRELLVFHAFTSSSILRGGRITIGREIPKTACQHPVIPREERIMGEP
jgi:hypothetical protein